MSQPSTNPDPEPPRELSKISYRRPKEKAVGFPAVLSSLRHINRQAGPIRGARALAKLNQMGGFDCPSCAWPDPDDERSHFEFCENGAKAVATEITTKRADPDFFARYSVEELAAKSDFWLNDAGRLTHPMVLDPGGSHYRPISWDQAFELLADELTAGDPDEMAFYTSGRTSNEAAFLFQLFVRQLGTNNLPDCSNMCHESSGAALHQTIGVGKGTVTLSEIEKTGCLLVMGQNPGTNHPRMLTSLEKMVQNGGKIISINPIFETGLKTFSHPQKVSGVLGRGTALCSLHVPVKINGDLAFLKGVIKCLFEEEARSPGRVLDHTFIQSHTQGFDAFQQAADAVSWKEIEEGSGVKESMIREVAGHFIQAPEAITCWAMGLTQHHNAVETIREIVNLHLLTGKIGRPNSGLCPVRGHSNVQGDRTMGIWEKMPEEFLKRLETEFQFTAPRKHGFDTVESIQAMHEGRIRVFFAMGGNFLSASPDTHFTAAALRQCRLTAHVATKLNRSHLITGDRALILPCLGRTEADVQNGVPQFVTVENSMSVVHSSQGGLPPASPHLLSEVAIICRMARATLRSQSHVPWEAFENDYSLIRDRIEAVIPGFEQFNQRARKPGGFYLPCPVRERRFCTASGRAEFTVNPLNPILLKPDELLLQTFRSHDQFNTTIYGYNDRYRGISNERRVIFMNPDDMKDRQISAKQAVDITSHFQEVTRTAELFLAIPFEIPRGCAAAYYPEANVLVPINSRAAISNTPASKSVIITVQPSSTSR